MSAILASRKEKNDVEIGAWSVKLAEALYVSDTNSACNNIKRSLYNQINDEKVLPNFPLYDNSFIFEFTYEFGGKPDTDMGSENQKIQRRRIAI